MLWGLNYNFSCLQLRQQTKYQVDGLCLSSAAERAYQKHQSYLINKIPGLIASLPSV